MKVKVCEQDGFKRVVTRVFIPEGALVLHLCVEDSVLFPTQTSIRVTYGIHAEDPVGACINHSCDPSCAVMGEHIVALHDLPVGTEVAFDYTENEDALAAPFRCLNCGKQVTGAPRPCQM